MNNISIIKTVCITFTAMMFLVLGGCGGGGNTQTGKNVSAKTTLAGNLPASVHGIDLTLVFPTGVSVTADTAGRVAGGVITTMAPNAGGSYSDAKYDIATGKLSISIIKGSSAFVAGDFFTINCTAAAGVATDNLTFVVENVKAYDNLGAEITPAPTASAGL